MKHCAKCDSLKPVSEFWKNKARKDGLQVYCKPCWYARHRAWVGDNQKEHAEIHSKWRSKNRDRCAAATARYRAKRLTATTQWANQTEIDRVYELAAWVSTLYGKPFEVDHIIPLQGRNVCGLHVENNLQIIPMFDNRSKSNKLIEEYL